MFSIAIQDANILIDCAAIGLLDAVFQLPCAFKTSDFIWAEITDEAQRQMIQPYIDSSQLTIATFTAAEVLRIAALLQTHNGVSFEDCSALYLAQLHRATLLTGDGKLRKVCRSVQVPVPGTLWLLDEVYDRGILRAAEACTKIRSLQALNPRLPQDALELRVQRWCG